MNIFTHMTQMIEVEAILSFVQFYITVSCSMQNNIKLI